MDRLKRLILEIHRRFLWQAFLIYLVAAYITFLVSQSIAHARDLPGWFIEVVIVLLAIGLPIILTTAFVQEGIPAVGRSDPNLRVKLEGGDGDYPNLKVEPARNGIRQLFTWRNAIMGGVAAFVLWAVAAAGWLVLADKLIGAAQESAAEEQVEGERN